MRILLFSPVFAPFANPEAIVNNKLVLAFMKSGWHIDVISRKSSRLSGYNYGSSWVAPWTPLKAVTHEIDYPLGGAIRRYSELARDALRMRYPIEGCRWAAHAFDLALELHQKNKYHVVLSRSLPDSGHLPALAFTKMTGIPWIANWNDPSGKKSPPPKGDGSNGKLNFFHNLLLSETSKKASFLTFPSERMRKYICGYLKQGSEPKGFTIPHAAMEISDIKKSRKNDIFIICHAGNLYSVREPLAFLGGLSEFIHKTDVQSKIQIKLIGFQDKRITNLINDLGIKRYFIFTGPLTYIETLTHLYNSDIQLVIEAPYSEGIYLPSKFVDYVQTGRPILALSPKNSELNDIITNHGGGIAADCRSPKEIENAFHEFYKAWKEGNSDEKYASAKIFNKFSPETITESYEKIFKKIGLLA